MKEVCNMDSDLDEFVSHFQKERIISEVQENLFSIYLRKTARLKVVLESVLWSIQNLKEVY